MANIWNQNEELDEDEELVVTDHRDTTAPFEESLDENAPEEEIPLEEARALEDSDQQNATTPPEDRRGGGDEAGHEHPADNRRTS
ncbi:MAG TPA: hypothetical protein H9830_04720 [Candidatus Agrococcus pullicola]|uniref:Uncharacterized protein n=1 Tax=Candidatus Agrococcus pullicola TaxID=2838429 RepID=A0A9D1YX39_9MICO|nr:hypothetical protein [Candidatus Agrococcus pullicola]